MLFVIFLAIPLLLTPCNATAALKTVDRSKTLDTNIIHPSPIGHTGIRVDPVDITIHRHLEEATILSLDPRWNRHLDKDDENKETVQIRSPKPFFPVLLATVIVNVLTLVVLLSVIPILMNSKWSCFKPTFLVANNHLKDVANITNQHMSWTRRQPWQPLQHSVQCCNGG